MRLWMYACIPVLTAAALAASPQGQEKTSGWRKVDAGQAASPKAEDVKLGDAQIQEIITKFAAKEGEFARARENYTYRQTSRVQEIDPSGAPGGKNELVEDVIFDGDGKRTERVVRAPVNSLQHILLTPEDEADLRSVQPFVLTTKELPKYEIRFVGKENVDEIPCFVFAVKPKKMEKGQRYFSGEIWVDDRDMQIVKTYGRGVGIVHGDNQFAKFETYREQIDGKYWFPTYTHADDVLNFQAGPQRIKMLVKYENYKQFKSDVNIQFGGEANPSAEPPKDQPKKP